MGTVIFILVIFLIGVTIYGVVDVFKQINKLK
jgi:hypothetical protein